MIPLLDADFSVSLMTPLWDQISFWILFLSFYAHKSESVINSIIKKAHDYWAISLSSVSAQVAKCFRYQIICVGVGPDPAGSIQNTQDSRPWRCGVCAADLLLLLWAQHIWHKSADESHQFNVFMLAKP